MQLPGPDKIKKAVLPGLFTVYILATIIAFLLHAQYFNAVLAKTFAEPTFPDQVAVDLPALDRVAKLINLDQGNIDALTSSRTKGTTTEIVEPVIPPATEAQPAIISTIEQIGTSSATMTPPITATFTRGSTTTKTSTTTIRTTNVRTP